MARIFIDGFESGHHDLWDAEGNATVVAVGATGMDGVYCLDLADYGEFLEKNITAVDEMYFAMMYRYTSAANHKGILSVFSDTNIMNMIRRNSVTGFINVLRASTLLDAGSKTLLINTTYLVEIYLKIADAPNGRIIVKVDGITDIDFTGDTLEAAYTQFNRVRLGFYSYDLGAGFAYYDNFIMDNADWIGNTNIQAVLPTGAGTTTEWTPSTGSNYACVDERPPSDVDYVSTNTVDLTDTYATGNLAGTIGSVKCVQVQARALVDGEPTPTNLKLAVRSGGTDYLSGDNEVPIAAKSFSHLWELNPADAAAWEEADVNAMEIGVKSAA